MIWPTISRTLLDRVRKTLSASCTKIDFSEARNTRWEISTVFRFVIAVFVCFWRRTVKRDITLSRKTSLAFKSLFEKDLLNTLGGNSKRFTKHIDFLNCSKLLNTFNWGSILLTSLRHHAIKNSFQNYLKSRKLIRVAARQILALCPCYFFKFLLSRRLGLFLSCQFKFKPCNKNNQSKII